MRDVGDMSRAVAIMEVDGSTSLRVTPEALFNTFLRLTDEAVKVCVCGCVGNHKSHQTGLLICD